MDKWELALTELSDLMQRLQAMAPIPWGTPGAWPKTGGIYVLHEDGKPIYVGRTDNLRQRLGQHGRPSSGHNSASFAFNLAKEEAVCQGMEVKGKSRNSLQADPVFAALFEQTRKRVRRMTVRFVVETNPIHQTLFEVYVALQLETPYNNFVNH